MSAATQDYQAIMDRSVDHLMTNYNPAGAGCSSRP